MHQESPSELFVHGRSQERIAEGRERGMGWRAAVARHKFAQPSPMHARRSYPSRLRVHRWSARGGGLYYSTRNWRVGVKERWEKKIKPLTRRFHMLVDEKEMNFFSICCSTYPLSPLIFFLNLLFEPFRERDLPFDGVTLKHIDCTLWWRRFSSYIKA
jgi:hypothetical protein